jgi:prepilin-type N-terminal cleavage/methylation domain-containing protein
MRNRRHTSPTRASRAAFSGARRAPRARASARAAFTLVEILTVVIILGISAAIIIPSVGNRDDMRVASAARLLMADLIYAQNKAIATQTPYYVWFDTTNKRYSIHDTAPTATTTATDAIDHPLHPTTFSGKYVTAYGVVNSQLAAISMGTVDFAGKQILKFDELGVPWGYDVPTATPTQLTGASVGKVSLNCGSFTLTVTIEPYTGEMTVN